MTDDRREFVCVWPMDNKLQNSSPFSLTLFSSSLVLHHLYQNDNSNNNKRSVQNAIQDALSLDR